MDPKNLEELKSAQGLIVTLDTTTIQQNYLLEEEEEEEEDINQHTVQFQEDDRLNDLMNQG